MSTPISSASPPFSPKLEQKCLFQNEKDWRPLKANGDEEAKKAAEQTGQMLRERLGSLLLSQNLLLLVGSGASVAVGGPSMTALWDEAAEAQKAVFPALDLARRH